MPTWGVILEELTQQLNRTGALPFDSVRQKYLAELHSYTNRPTIVYATKWIQQGGQRVDPGLISITDEDVQGLMEVIYGLKSTSLDLILHSPGGSPDAAEGLVTYLRSKFTDIRVIVPHMAMSAATMVACASNEIILGKHSFLGPIDPQIILQTPLGLQAVPAHAILDQFQLAQQECQDSRLLGSWLPILHQYGPGLLVQCTNAISLSQELVRKWLHLYMFNGAHKHMARAIARHLSDHRHFRSHSRHIDILSATQLGLRVSPLERDHELQSRVLSSYHATMHTFNGTPAVKIIENHLGKAFIKMTAAPVIQPPRGAAPPLAIPGVPPSSPPPKAT